MATLLNLYKAVRTHLNDQQGIRFGDDTVLKSALEEALRQIALISGVPLTVLYSLGKVSDPLAITDDTFVLPDPMVRILNARVGSAPVVAIKAPDYEWKKNETIAVPTFAEPWIAYHDGKPIIMPIGQFGEAGLKVIVTYVPDPPDVLLVAPSLDRALTLAAASDIALDKEQNNLGMVLKQRRDAELQAALNLPIPKKERDTREP